MCNHDAAVFQAETCAKRQVRVHYMSGKAPVAAAGASHNDNGMLLLLMLLLQVEKCKCKLLDLEAQQSDDHDTSEGGDSCDLQTQVLLQAAPCDM